MQSSQGEALAADTNRAQMKLECIRPRDSTQHDLLLLPMGMGNHGLIDAHSIWCFCIGYVLFFYHQLDYTKDLDLLEGGGLSALCKTVIKSVEGTYLTEVALVVEVLFCDLWNVGNRVNTLMGCVQVVSRVTWDGLHKDVCTGSGMALSGNKLVRQKRQQIRLME